MAQQNKPDVIRGDSWKVIPAILILARFLRTVAPALVILVGSGIALGQTQSLPATPTKEVEVFLVYENSTGPLVTGDLYPLTRHVSRQQPLQGALNALIEGPTAEEAKLGYQSIAYAPDMKLSSVKLNRGIAYAYFTRAQIQGSPPDLSSLKFEEAVTKTARQFPTVKKVVVCVNEMVEFGLGLVEDVPRPCPIKRN